MARCMLSVDVFFVGLAAKMSDVFQLALFQKTPFCENSVLWLVDLPLLYFGVEVWRERQSKFTPSTKLN